MLDINLLKSLYQINSKSGHEEALIDFIIQYVEQNYPPLIIEQDSSHNIYITKGDAKEYPCIVAHLDQVGSYTGDIGIFRQNNIIIGIGANGKQVNLGADDKNGIWIALQLLRSTPAIKLAFFVGEETGCAGSKACDMSFFSNVKYVIQCDRRNGGDFITGTWSLDFCNEDFIPKDLLQKYHYSPTTGLMTDVEALKSRGLNVAACNLSCGYYNPHTDQEYTDITELINCLSLVRELIQRLPKVPHTATKKTYGHYAGYGQMDYDNDNEYGEYFEWRYYR